MEHERIFKRLIVTLGNREQHDLVVLSHHKFRGAHKVADVLNHQDIQVLDGEVLDGVMDHVCVEVALAAGVYLHGVALLVFGKLDDASSSVALESLAPVKGVDSKSSKADAKEGQISVKLSGKDDDDDDDDPTLRIADILTALEEAGILVSLSKT